MYWISTNTHRKKKSVLENLQLKLTRLKKQTSKKPWTTTITTKPKQKPQPKQQNQNTKQKKQTKNKTTHAWNSNKTKPTTTKQQQYKRKEIKEGKKLILQAYTVHPQLYGGLRARSWIKTQEFQFPALSFQEDRNKTKAKMSRKYIDP